jgi:hypothetical protein
VSERDQRKRQRPDRERAREREREKQRERERSRARAHTRAMRWTGEKKEMERGEKVDRNETEKQREGAPALLLLYYCFTTALLPLWQVGWGCGVGGCWIESEKRDRNRNKKKRRE